MTQLPFDPLERQFGEALGSSEPFDALRQLAKALVARQVPRSELIALFQEQLNRQANAFDEKAYNALADVMDLIAGWCSPEASLYQSDASRGGA